MAEVFGIVAGSVSIAAVFSNCVDCFGYVRLARDFEGDFKTFLLQLSCARLRLSRWGQSIRVLDPALMEHMTRVELQAIEDILFKILGLFEQLAKKSAKYRTPELIPEGSDDLHHRVQVRMERIVEERVKRQKRPTLKQRTTWALYRASHMKSLLHDITELIGGLESIALESRTHQFAALQRELLHFEVSQLGQEHELQDVANAFREIDPELFIRAGRQAVRFGHEYAQVSVSGTTVGLFGDSASNSWRGGTLGTFHSFGSLNMKDAAKAQFGNSHGGKGVFG